MAAGGFPDAEVVAEEGLARWNPKELAGDKAVLLVHAGVDFRIDLDERGVE